MRKRIFLVLCIMVCSFRTCIIYGGENFYKTTKDEKTYINGILIDSYGKDIIAEDLRNYGFNVTWDTENKILNINRIPDSFPTASNIIKIRSPKKENKTGKIMFEDVRKADYRILMDGIEIYGYFTKDGTLISIEFLEKYGSLKKIEGETTYYYITLSYNYPTVTAPDGTAIKVTQPVYDFARDVLLKEVNPDTSRMLGTYVYIKEPHLSGIQDIGSSVNGGYSSQLSEEEIYMDAAILNELNIKYNISDNKLTILSIPSKEIRLQYQNIFDFGEPQYSLILGEYRPDKIAELSCVDLKLFSNKTEIKTENKFPSFLDYNGKLVIKLQDLSQALNMDFSVEKIKDSEGQYQNYYKMTPKQ